MKDHTSPIALSSCPIVHITPYGIVFHIVAVLAVTSYIRGLWLACSIVAWEVLYYVSMRCYTRIGGVRMLAGHARWTYVASAVHGMVLLPGALGLALYHLTALYEPDQGPGPLLKEFLIASAAGPQSAGYKEGMGAVTDWLEHIFLIVIAYMLKDWALLGDEVKVGYVVHHTATVIGALMCLAMPFGLGISALNGVQAEFASTIYSLRCVYRNSKWVGLLYYMLMTGSNVLALYLVYILVTLGCPLVWAVPYGIICVMLVVLREGGVLMDMLGAGKRSAAGTVERKEQ